MICSWNASFMPQTPCFVNPTLRHLGWCCCLVRPTWEVWNKSVSDRHCIHWRRWIQLSHSRCRMLLLCPNGVDLKVIFPDGLAEACKAIRIAPTQDELKTDLANSPADLCLLLQPPEEDGKCLISNASQGTALRVYQAHRWLSSA